MNHIPNHFRKHTYALLTLKCSFSTVIAFMISLSMLFAQADPNTGPGGPVLVIHTASNPFSRYTAEILRAEGLNEFAVQDITAVTAAVLNNYDVVVLGEMTVSAAQATMFTTWVNAGGVLIAFRPSANIRTLMGIAVVGGSPTLSNQYLLIATANGPGKGLVNQTIQFHGTADLYTLNAGTASIATLYSNATTATTRPAVTTRNVGANGGKTIAFTYDLCRSIVYTRQGNPAWAGDDRDGNGVIRAIDMYYGAKVGDVQPEWLNFNKIQIPQADEQQRLLANIIIQSNQHKKPLPRFWYLPRDLKAAVVMSGDDHAIGGTAERFNHYKKLSVSNTQEAVDDWIAIRSTSNIYPGFLTNAEAVAFQSDGFEISMHLNTNCNDYSAASLLADYTAQLSQFAAAYPGLNAPSTNRTHCAVWSDWASKPTVEVSKGVRLNGDYYYWPDTWVQNRPGLFTGSGLPMRLANTNGAIFDNYQLPTQITDESGITVSTHINTLLDNAIGVNGYYGVFGTQMHTDYAFSTESDDIIKAAQTRNIPVISAKQMLTWLDGRNNSSFGAFNWSSNQLSFTITAASGSKNLRAMLPKFTGSTNNLSLQSITLNGNPVSFSIQTIKGYQYAFFNGITGNYVATYASFVCAAPTATLVTVPTASCLNSPVSLQLSAATGTSPFSIVVNGTTYDNVTVGSAFTTSTTNEVSLWNTAPVFAVPNETDGQPVELGMKFRSSVAGYVTGVQFYKGGLNTGSQVGKLYSSAGVLLASVTFTNANDASVGWKQARFSQPVFIQPNTTYVVTYYTPSGYYAYSDFYFTNAFTKGPLTALQDGTDGPNGLGGYGSGFPDQTFQSRNYWVDVLFIPDINTNQNIDYILTGITDLNGCTNTGANLSTATLSLKPLPKGTIATETPGVCSGSNIRLIYTSANSGTGPFQLTVNGNVYNNVQSGVAFSTGITATLSTTLSLTTVTDNGGCSITKETPVTLNVGSCGPLPVELIAFNVAARQSDALLDWSTSTEVNNKGFDVQRSKDAANWETIGFVKGAGQSSAVNHYQYRDKGLQAGRYFYRLIQIDFNDKKSISAIKSITLNGQLDFDLKQNYPNPFNQSTVIEFTIPTRQNVLIGIYDIKGRLIQTLMNETRQKGTYTMRFDRKGLSAGMYYLKMETFEYKAVRKFVIE